jgi:hypothetical protein
MGKHHHLLRHALGRIHRGTFSELEVLALLILAREQASEGSVIHELGDFTAHRKRDRGPFTKYVSIRKREVTEGKALVGPPLELKDFRGGLLNENPIFTIEDFGQELDALSAQVGLDMLPDGLVHAIATMVISILQGVTFVEGPKQAPQEVGRVIVALTHHYIAAVAVLEFPGTQQFLPLLAVPNTCYSVPVSHPGFFGIIPDEELQVECVDGNLVVQFLNP